MLEYAIKPLLKTYFNLTERKCIFIEQNRHSQKVMTMVKDIKRHVSRLSDNNDDKDMQTWTHEYYHSYLKAHKEVLQGKTELHTRCMLLKKLSLIA